MHSFAPYAMRSFNPHAGKDGERYFKLNKIGQLDIYELVEEFFNLKKKYEKDEDKKHIFKLTDFVFDKKSRVIYGWLETGPFGITSDIVNIDTGHVEHTKGVNSADVIRHFIYFFLPKEVNESIVLFHSYRGRGIKTIFYDEFGKYFKDKTKFSIQLNPLSYEQALKDWQKAKAKELKLIEYKPLKDKVDQLTKLGHLEKDLVLKPQKNLPFGTFADFGKKGTEQHKLVELVSDDCEQIKLIVELHGRKRTFRIGHNSSNRICEIDFPEELIGRDGNPSKKNARGWCKEIVTGFCDQMYPNTGIKP